MSATISDATLALVNKAEADVIATQTAQSAAAAAQTALGNAQTVLASATAAVTSAQQTQMQDSVSAIAALETELGMPLNTAITINNPTAMKMHGILSQDDTVKKAVNAGLTWQQIVTALLQGGLTALQGLIPKPSTGS